MYGRQRVTKHIFYFELEEGSRRQIGQLLRYKDMLQHHIKKCNINTWHWERLATKRPQWSVHIKTKVQNFEEHRHWMIDATN